MMRVGSIVETVGDFEELRQTWGYAYPKKGDMLTVSMIMQHHVPEMRMRGIMMLCFEEKPGLIPLSDRTVNGEDNFVEVLPPINLAVELGMDITTVLK